MSRFDDKWWKDIAGTFRGTNRMAMKTDTAMEGDIQRMTDMLAELLSMSIKHEYVADMALSKCFGSMRGTQLHVAMQMRCCRLEELRMALSAASHASQRALIAVMDGKMDASINPASPGRRQDAS